ncbi:hypothetical protein KM918_28590 [Priestia megaterium]|uniref:hypothetical protein n=1 Tax=Priestia megaterium TaxID=1404 RepID=UPI001C2485B4|nr:hypothetical protein [Priestia megaterium]MBU8691240.1 hypothetical protein [Priestia megaterium]
MEKEWMPVISAAIGGLVAILVVFINQVMEHLRWKENLNRKGQDKYLDKKIETLHESIVDFFQLANEALRLSRSSKMDAKQWMDGIRVVDKSVRTRIALLSPYIDKNLEHRIENLYDALTVIRLIFNKEMEGTNEDIVANLLWLNAELHFLNDDLGVVMREFHKKEKKANKIGWIFTLSIVLNICFLIYVCV